MPLRQISISYLCFVSHLQPLTLTPALGLARVLTSLEEMPWSSLCFQILDCVPQICQTRSGKSGKFDHMWQISSGPVLPAALPFTLTHYSNYNLLEVSRLLFNSRLSGCSKVLNSSQVSWLCLLLIFTLYFSLSRLRFWFKPHIETHLSPITCIGKLDFSTTFSLIVWSRCPPSNHNWL